MFPAHPLGREVLGDPEVIRSVTVDEIRQFMAVHYRPANVVVAAAGQVDHGSIGEGLERRFAGLAGGASPQRVPPSDEVRPLDVTVRDCEQAHLVLGVRAPARQSPSRFALALLNHVLGGGISSRLFQSIREERGLAYSIISERVAFADSGALVVSVGTSPDKAAEVVGLVVAELDHCAGSGITAGELDRAKGHIAADLLLGLEDSGNRMSRIGVGLLLFDEVLSVDEQLARIDAVSLDEVGTLAGEVLGGRRVLTVVGPSAAGDFAPLD
jgi:predicted Zn-dependent peptidase